MKTIAIFYYTQSGQALEIAQSIGKTLEEYGIDSNEYNVVFKEIEPQKPFPFYWSRKAFFEIFPETRLGLPPIGIKPIDTADINDASLVIIVGQSWFLSPSIPLQAFFMNPAIKRYLQGKDVIFVNGCRNMWLMTFQKVKAYLNNAKASFVGHIVLQDRHPNLISAYSIVQWLINGKRVCAWGLVRAGISKEDIAQASRFGKIIGDDLKKQQMAQLQAHLLEVGAIDYSPSILFIEKTGHRIFGFWAKFIRQKGEYGDYRRQCRINMFFYYLLFVLFLASPFAVILFYATYLFRPIQRQKYENCNNLK